MLPIAKIDSLKVRQQKLMSGQKIRCAYPGCQIQFHPDERTSQAYLKKGYCYCHSHNAMARQGFNRPTFNTYGW